MNIGIVGPFGDINFGDYAMLVNNVIDLGKDNHYWVFTYNIDLLAYLKQIYLSDYEIDECLVKCAYEYKSTITEKYHIEYDLYAYTPIEVLNYIENIDEITECLNQVEVLLVNGGGYFNCLWSAKHRKGKLFCIISTILLANLLNKKIFFSGNTFGPFDGNEDFFSMFFNSLKYVEFSARDNIMSKAWLRRLGIYHQINCVPDDLYFITKDIVDKANDDTLLMGKYMILEFYDSIDEIKNKMNEIENFVNCMNKNYGLNVFLMPLDHGFGGEIQSELIAEMIPQIALLKMPENSPRKIEYVLNIIKNADMVLCQRYHMFTVAISNNIPAIHILKDVCYDKRYYYTKSAGMLKQVFSNQIYAEDIFLKKDIWDGMKCLCENYPDISAKQKALFNNKKNESEEVMRIRRKDLINKIR